ncbi:putative phosphoglycerate mutase [Clavispora lusitaniae]|uniref:Phosphoglycerate mutase n=3 Tax=Clavispora lusitaniae TaxID=36911 RepID=C4XZM6_CLAL4|nr:uncharacterized protein CLUG_01408 [Clavispora lusitaniae ATCC 42720]KAF7583743.1 phosphoglycerate mutase 1 family protein [Clavispora lusitaniae]EEQ37285.1 hypothetical protein CLUG_01408 [Clavispora lusitaniae ATCC 42720]OVF09071.1 putative phosphoglycerate mutase [Clavispora lusitaniae]QFZ26292.1 putative phosphoglycerate mutase [Clavispora lusitaniae]QFZ31960.1 putative phosphoglycerate mutase [Clavispora lusitaniae]
MAHKLIVLRHGESQWNHENRFCGWIDIPLSAKGEQEAQHAGELIKKYNIKPDIMYTSMLQRSIKTGNIILETLGRSWIPEIKTWRLNERHYGSFQGRDKTEVFNEYGKEKFQYYRRDFHAIPPRSDVDEDTSVDERYANLDRSEIPTGESLELTMARLIPFVSKEIVEQSLLTENKTVLVVTHGSIVRSLIKHFDNVSDADISKINAPTGVPLVFELDQDGHLARPHYYLDEELAKKGMAKVAMEGQQKL